MQTTEELLLLKRLMALIETEGSKPKVAFLEPHDQLAESARQLGRQEVLGALIDFIKRENR